MEKNNEKSNQKSNQKSNDKGKKVLLPIIMVLAILTIGFIVLTIAVKVTGSHSSKLSSVKGDGSTEAVANSQEVENVYEYELDDYSTAGESASVEVETEQSDKIADTEGYIIANSDSVELTSADLEDLTAQELTYARNEIYARHGYVFQSSELNEYFATKSWYTADESFEATGLSELELKNAETIGTYQTDNNLIYEVQ